MRFVKGQVQSFKNYHTEFLPFVKRASPVRRASRCQLAATSQRQGNLDASRREVLAVTLISSLFQTNIAAADEGKRRKLPIEQVLEIIKVSTE
jgi:hypothetical protein